MMSEYRVWTKQLPRDGAAQVTVDVWKDRASVILLPGQRLIFDLSLNGELLVLREDAAQYDDRAAVEPA